MRKLRLFASDLDHTMFTPGEPADTESLKILMDWLKDNSIKLSYVSGRSFDMVWDVMAEYSLPMPDYIISSVGTCITHHKHGKWVVLDKWRDRLRSKWSHITVSKLTEMMSSFPQAQMQPDQEQGEFKLSYRILDDEPLNVWERRVEQGLKERDLEITLIISQGGESPICVDFVPNIASKSKALEFLAEEMKITKDGVVYAGDSGNDEDALACGVFGILVAGGEAGLAHRLGKYKRIYCANSLQVKGILEGLRHFRFMKEVK
ncbi:MAG: HAD-IIB family hydrolase [Pseudomonadota bacterium]